ncbi:MAG: class I SAM-dependent methyltransferase [Selenomonadaceae bacterium]|nr:class I SAM-dependent methyltransferase [Selenomonadaceae bacterium]
MKLLQNKCEIEIRIERYWDKRSGDFSKLRRKELESENYAPWRDLILSRLKNKKPLKILDVGTGAGFFAAILSKEGHSVVGIDMSEGMIKAARETLAAYKLNAEFIKMAADSLYFPQESFDAVVSRNLTWTLLDAMEAYREWHRVLKRGGILLNFDSDVGRTEFVKKNTEKDVHFDVTADMVKECNDIKASLRISTHTRPKWDVELLKNIGFKVEFDTDISKIVRKDKNLVYDDLPIFGIYGEKC